MRSDDFLTLDPAGMSVLELHPYLLGTVAPRPIALASTVDAEGRPNLAPFSYFNVFSAAPPVLVFSPARRGRDNTTKHTLENVLAVPEVVIHLVDYALVGQSSLASSDFPEGVNEIEMAGLTALPSECVRPPRVAEAPVAFECRVDRVEALGAGAGAGNLVVCEVVRIHLRRDVLGPDGRPSPQLLDLVGRCGGETYVRASGEALFEWPKPGTRPGMGFGALPADIRLSKVLTGNHLALLAGQTAFPDETEVNEYKLLELAELFLAHDGRPSELEAALHRTAADLLDAGDISAAWKCLLAYNG